MRTEKMKCIIENEMHHGRRNTSWKVKSIMEGEARRKKILEILGTQTEPVSGTSLSKKLGVSRQVIVQDIALLRAVNKNILATTKGYILYHQEKEQFYRGFYVCHDNDAIKDELYTIIDNGGKVLDILVEHEVYGQISADLILKTRQDVDVFCKKLKESCHSRPLNIISGGPHIHTVEAASETILDNIERALKEKGYLISA